MSFLDKIEEGEGKLRPFPSWYGGLDMGSLPHLYFPTSPIRDSDIDLLLSIENEGLKSWKRVKKSGELEIYSRKGLERGSPPVTKVTESVRQSSRSFRIEIATICWLIRRVSSPSSVLVFYNWTKDQGCPRSYSTVQFRFLFEYSVPFLACFFFLLCFKTIDISENITLSFFEFKATTWIVLFWLV